MKHAFLAATLALGACVSSPITEDPVRSDGLARLGEATRVGALVVTPQSVVEDSRCPMNARCIWAGRAIVRTRIDGAGWRETSDLELGKPLATHGTSIALTSVQPEKMAGTAPPPQPYLFGFESGR